MDIALNGILSGIVLAFLVGPVFFTIIQTSIERGFWSGALVAIGVSLSDAFYITLAYLGLSSTFDYSNSQIYLAYGGGIILLAFGFYYLFIKSKRLHYYDPEKIHTRSPFRLIAKGFVINGISPMVLFFWIGIVGVATTELGYDKFAKASLYFAFIICTVFITDLIKAKLADKLRVVLTPKFIRALNIVLGVILVIFGGRLIFYADHLNDLLTY